MGAAQIERSRPLPPQLLRHRPRTRAEQPHLQRTLQPPRRRLCRPRRQLPLHVTVAGVIGCITVSGLPQREDHNLVVEALCLELKQNHDSLRLA
ncbi:heme-binding protein [Tunturiibacter empetritectus]